VTGEEEGGEQDMRRREGGDQDMRRGEGGDQDMRRGRAAIICSTIRNTETHQYFLQSCGTKFNS